MYLPTCVYITALASEILCAAFRFGFSIRVVRSAKRPQYPELIEAYLWGFAVVPEDGLCCSLIQKTKPLS